MSSEARKGLVRIFSNYSRLLITLSLGIAVVPLTLRWLGDEAFGLISLLGANIGLAGIFRQIIQMSLVRELGQAYHADDETFHKNYATICVISLICALLTIASFGVVLALLPMLNMPEHYIWPARWFIIGQGAYTAVMTILAPVLNMYLVKERFVGYNIWYIGVRACNILSVVILGYVIVINDPALGLSLHGLLWGGLSVLGMGIAAMLMIRSDPRLWLRYKGGDKESRSQVFSTFSWNTAVQIATNLHEQIPPLLLNLFFGPIVNAAWGIGFRFVVYIRMATTGVQFGSDAVSARLASGDDTEASRKQLQRLIAVQTKLTSMIALPAAVGTLMYCWVIFDVWVGSSLESYDEVIPLAVNMTRILVIALAARAISETWLIVLYGAGFVRSYAPWVFFGGILAPVGSIVFMFTLPDSLAVYAPAAMYALVLLVVHLFGLPVIAGRCLHIQPWSLLMALARPMVAVVVALSAALGTLYFGGRLTDLGFTGQLTIERGQAIQWAWVLGSIAVFGMVYVVCAFMIVLDSSDRARVMGLIRRRS